MTNPDYGLGTKKYKIMAFNNENESLFFGNCFKEEIIEKLRLAREHLDGNWRLVVFEKQFAKKKNRKQNYKIYSIRYSKGMPGPVTTNEKSKHLFED